MLNNAGKKIVLWSQILLIAGIALSVIGGIFIIVRGAVGDPLRVTYYNTTYLYRTGMLYGGRYIAAGLLVMIFGSLSTWLCALLLRAFGDLTDDTRAIRERLEDTTPASVVVEAPEVMEPAAPVKKRTRKPAAPKAETPENTDGQ